MIMTEVKISYNNEEYTLEELLQKLSSSEEKIKDIIKLFDTQQEAGLFSLLGGTGMESVESTLELVDDKKLTALWNSIRK